MGPTIESTQKDIDNINSRLQRLVGRSKESQATPQPATVKSHWPQPQPQLQQQPPPEKTKPVAIIVGDSNVRHLIPERLHEEKKVIVENRFTLEEALKNIPKTQPEVVTDVVMLIGLNDIRSPSASIPDTIAKYDRTCKTYQKHFPKSIIHIGSVAPSCEKHMRFNNELEYLAKIRNVPFIPSHQFLEPADGEIRPKPNTLSGIHYTRSGIRLLANEIKRSLYRKDIHI